jgi:predicted transcriptional regulator
VPYEGIIYVLDLDACLYFTDAGENLKSALFQKAKEIRIVITKETFEEVKNLDKGLAKEIDNSEIEIVELGTDVYNAASALTDLFISSGYAPIHQTQVPA